jgi:hypothetical protein
MKYTDQFMDPQLLFDKGVAAIDVITLNGAGKAAEPYVPEKSITLPSETDCPPTELFDDLMQIKLDPSLPAVSAIIDTKKMTWLEQNDAQKCQFDDYTGAERRGVKFKKLQVSIVDQSPVVIAPLKLEDGRDALMWFSEVSTDWLNTSGYYALYNRAKSLTSSFDKASAETYDVVKVPAQQIDYVRLMTEIMQMNKDLPKVEQIFKVALDETGARVYAETKMRLGAIMTNPGATKEITLGSKNPVMFWLTDTDFAPTSTPFAVIVTTSEAWLAPDQKVTFTFEGVDEG